MNCQDCQNWTEKHGSGGNWGLCKPTAAVLPFWASRHQAGMQTQTLRNEGKHCEAFKQRTSS